VESWRRDFSTLTTFLDYPEQIRSSIYTINILERANKEIKRRTKTIEVFSYVKAIEKILYLISTELNEKWSRRVHRGFIKAKPILEKMRREDFPRHKILDTMFLSSSMSIFFTFFAFNILPAMTYPKNYDFIFFNVEYQDLTAILFFSIFSTFKSLSIIFFIIYRSNQLATSRQVAISHFQTGRI